MLPSSSAHSAQIWPVSYTQLDVYKRQIISTREPIRTMKNSSRLEAVMLKNFSRSNNKSCLSRASDSTLLLNKSQLSSRFVYNAGFWRSFLSIFSDPFFLCMTIECSQSVHSIVLYCDISPVSYTHLDVYKRQSLFCILSQACRIVQHFFEFHRVFTNDVGEL